MEQWLRQSVAAYEHGERVHADVGAVLARFPALRPKSDVYTYDDGRAQLLLCLHGLLPIAFRGASYNIPIAIWITRDYPRRPPIPYVVPTQDMLVRPSRHVDLSGRVGIEYMQDWLRKPEACHLAALLEAMQDLFSRAPPLYAKPKSPAPAPGPASDRPPLPPKPIDTPRPVAPTAPPPPPPPLPQCPPQASPPHLLDDEPAPLPPAPAPPRPPNPELLHLHAQLHDKLRSEFSALSQLMRLETDRVRAQQSDLLAGELAIRDEMARLEAVGDVCRNVAARLQAALEQADRNLGDLRRKGDPEVDELVCSTSIVHNQLINLVAEDNAIEDTIYHLHRALNAGRIDLERFLRTTRVLAEEQFMKRALIDKIQVGMQMRFGPPYS